MDIEGTHEDPDQHFLLLEVLAHDIIHGNADASLDRDDRLSGRHRFDIDYGAVGRAQQSFSGKRMPRGVAKKPDITPIAEATNHKQAGSRQKTCEHAYSVYFHRVSCITRTKATPEEKGKLTISKNSSSRFRMLSHRLTPA